MYILPVGQYLKYQWVNNVTSYLVLLSSLRCSGTAEQTTNQTQEYTNDAINPATTMFPGIIFNVSQENNIGRYVVLLGWDVRDVVGSLVGGASLSAGSSSLSPGCL